MEPNRTRGPWPLPKRPAAAHKGDFGRVFILAGSEGYTGAPVLAARAALRTGAGLVFLGVPREIWPIVAVGCGEAMAFPLPERYFSWLSGAVRGAGGVMPADLPGKHGSGWCSMRDSVIYMQDLWIDWRGLPGTAAGRRRRSGARLRGEAEKHGGVRGEVHAKITRAP